MSKKIFAVEGNKYWPAISEPGAAISELKGRNYYVRLDVRRGFYFEDAPAFELPKKIYGREQRSLPDRILRTFEMRGTSTGVALVGGPGSGKTLLAKQTCVKAVSMEIPVLILTRGFYGDMFIDFLNHIEQPCVVFVDEFDKQYTLNDGKNESNELLTILDGVAASNKLWMFTSNKKLEDINNFLVERPSRIFYRPVLSDYMSPSAVREYMQDYPALGPRFKFELARYAHQVGVNMDTLSCLVAEHLRYKESISELRDMMGLPAQRSGLSGPALRFRWGRDSMPQPSGAFIRLTHKNGTVLVGSRIFETSDNFPPRDWDDESLNYDSRTCRHYLVTSDNVIGRVFNRDEVKEAISPIIADLLDGSGNTWKFESVTDGLCGFNAVSENGVWALELHLLYQLTPATGEGWICDTRLLDHDTPADVKNQHSQLIDVVRQEVQQREKKEEEEKKAREALANAAEGPPENEKKGTEKMGHLARAVAEHIDKAVGERDAPQLRITRGTPDLIHQDEFGEPIFPTTVVRSTDTVKIQSLEPGYLYQVPLMPTGAWANTWDLNSLRKKDKKDNSDRNPDAPNNPT